MMLFSILLIFVAVLLMVDIFVMNKKTSLTKEIISLTKERNELLEEFKEYIQKEIEYIENLNILTEENNKLRRQNASLISQNTAELKLLLKDTKDTIKTKTKAFIDEACRLQKETLDTLVRTDKDKGE